MKKAFVTRSITSAVFVIVLVVGILLSPITMLALFAVISTLGLLEYYKIVSSSGYKPQRITGIILGLLILFINFLIASNYANTSLSILYILPVFAVAIHELYRNLEHPFTNIAHTLFGVLYVATPCGLTSFLVYNNLHNFTYDSGVLIALFLLIWASDSGAYIVGSLIGKHKLFPRISPKKTWEGSLGGAVLSIIVSILIAQYITEVHILHWITIAVLTVVFGTFGDLIESMLKRKANIKDSGNILPGHGGILDRFDSFFTSAPVVLLYINFVL